MEGNTRAEEKPPPAPVLGAAGSTSRAEGSATTEAVGHQTSADDRDSVSPMSDLNSQPAGLEDDRTPMIVSPMSDLDSQPASVEDNRTPQFVTDESMGVDTNMAEQPDDIPGNGFVRRETMSSRTKLPDEKGTHHQS